MTITTTKDSKDLSIYKLDEVALRDGKGSQDAWIIVNDLVYDVASVLGDHPGGVELILEYAGKDCTKEFNEVGHSADALADLKKCLIGKLAEVSGEN